MVVIVAVFSFSIGWWASIVYTKAVKRIQMNKLKRIEKLLATEILN